MFYIRNDQKNVFWEKLPNCRKTFRSSLWRDILNRTLGGETELKIIMTRNILISFIII